MKIFTTCVDQMRGIYLAFDALSDAKAISYISELEAAGTLISEALNGTNPRRLLQIDSIQSIQWWQPETPVGDKK